MIDHSERSTRQCGSGQITSNHLTQASWRLYEIRQPNLCRAAFAILAMFCICGVSVLNTVWLSGQTPDVTVGKSQPRRYLFLQSIWQHDLTTDELVINRIILLCCVESFILRLLTTRDCGASVCGVFFYLTSRQRLLDCLMGRSGPPPSPSTPRLHSPCHAT